MGARGGVPECLVWSLGIVRRLEAAQRLLKRRQVEIAVVAFPELAPHGAVEALDAAIELGTVRRQHVEGDVLGLTGGLEARHELGAAVDLNRLDRDWHPVHELVEERRGRAGRGTGAHAEHGHPGDDIDGGELTPFDPRLGPQVHGVELDKRTGFGRLALLLRHPGSSGRSWRATA